MPIDPNIHPHWAAETKELAASVDRMDYFQILGVDQNASIADIKFRYHTLQREYHPDTFYQSPDTDLKASVMLIAKRVAEAYVILRDDEKRAKYTKDIAGPERESKLRYTEESAQEQRREKIEAMGKTPQGRQLVQKAQDSLRKGDLLNAERDLKTALLFESGNETIKAQLAEIQEMRKQKK